MKKLIFNADLLKREREKRGLKYLHLARELQKYGTKCSKSVVWQWETGGAQPTPRYVMALSDYFGRPMEDFYNKKAK